MGARSCKRNRPRAQQRCPAPRGSAARGRLDHARGRGAAPRAAGAQRAPPGRGDAACAPLLSVTRQEPCSLCGAQLCTVQASVVDLFQVMVYRRR